MLVANRNSLTVALVQMQSGSDVEANFRQASSFLDQAVQDHKAELVIFPENFLCLGVQDYSIVAEKLNAYQKEFTLFAKMHLVYIVLGSMPVLDSQGSCFSRSIVIDSQGELLGNYDKIHLFDVHIKDQQGEYSESKFFSAGKEYSTVSINNRQLGLSICYDLRFPELYQALRKRGAEMIAVPSAFTYKTGAAHWEVLLRARAIETQCFVFGANQCGSHIVDGKSISRQTWGHTMIVDPWGEILCSLKNEPGVCSAVLNFDTLNEVRQAMNLQKHKS